MKRREEGSIEERIQGKKYLIRWTIKDETGKSVRRNKIQRRFRRSSSGTCSHGVPRE